MTDFKLHVGNVLETLPTLPPKSVHTCVTSPPYFGLRSYLELGHPNKAHEIGTEPTPDEYVQKLVKVFREVKRVLRDDGTLWLNLGDSYAAGGMSNPSTKSTLGGGKDRGASGYTINRKISVGLKQKDLIGIPWRAAFALQADGWYLRSDIIWYKPNPMPESVTDRPTKSHEYVFLLSKSPKYYYDHEAIKETAVRPGDVQTFGGSKGRGYNPEPDDPNFRNGTEQWGRTVECAPHRNKRSVWTVATKPFSGAHFAVFPPDLIRPCILAGAPAGGAVLDPFTGSGTTGIVAAEHGRSFVGCELNETYAKEIAEPRLRAAYAQSGLFALV